MSPAAPDGLPAAGPAPAHPPPPVRRLLIDLNLPFERRWNGGDAFRSAFFNALSMSFPAGEQFFIDAVRVGVRALPRQAQARFAPELQGFVGQEATHRRLHALFNAQLVRQGQVNTWEGRIQRRMKRLGGADPRHAVAITAATEHFTAVFAEYLLATLWQWHAAEESEHRSTAFDLYRALGGNERWRRRWMRLVALFFVSDLARQTVRNLWHDGALLRASTLSSAVRFLFADGGLVRRTFQPWRAYFRTDFHPSKQGGELGDRWLRNNTAHFVEVGLPG